MRAIFFLAAIPAFSQTLDNLDAVLWTQTSVEYQAGARQTYAAARTALDRGLATPHWTAVPGMPEIPAKPPAIILDLDETILDNSAYRARRLLDGGKPFTLDSWNAWVAEAKAGLVPGAREFLDYARSRGVAIFFVTNRDCKNEPSDATFRNLKTLGLDGELRCRTDTSDKEPRRYQIAYSHRVVLLIGDDFNDFLTAAPTLAERQKQLDRFAPYFGERWFIVPNAMYGSWERPFADSVQKKREALRP
jgi:acid phosphatase